MKPWFKIVRDHNYLYVELTGIKIKRLSNRQMLEMSIEKFKSLREAVTPETLQVGTGSSCTCPLCWEYAEKSCAGCPIHEQTGSFGCHGTPYYKILDACGADKIKAALDAEITFLEMVLKGEEK